jgi:hypothetical protein
MRIPSRTVVRFAWAVVLGLLSSMVTPRPAPAAAPGEKALPNSTILFVKIPSVAKLRDGFRQSQLGQLWADPALQPLKDDFAAKLEEPNAKLKQQIGLTLGELLSLPQGPLHLAVLGRDDAKLPIAVLLTLDTGDNAQRVEELFAKLTDQAEKGEGKVSTEDFKDLKLHILRSAKEEDKDAPPIIWTRMGSVFYAGSDLDALKDLIAHADGREDSLADSESFGRVVKKVGAEGHLLWYIDLAQLIKLASSKLTGAAKGNPQQVEAMLQVIGLNGLKAAGGNFAFNAGGYDSQSKMFVLAPGPAQGLLRIFKLTPASLRPEPWVPASASSYESISWDLDEAYNAINDLANTFNPGLLDVLAQQLAGPNGAPINFKKDIFGPLGNRITVISDFKKPAGNQDKDVLEDNQRTLIAIALSDAKAFQNTFNRVLELAKANPKKREFQGTTIYDFEIPNPGNAGGPKMNIQGPISVSIAKDTCFVSFEPTMLEQVLRGGGPRLAENAEFQAVAREIPEHTSTLSYAKPEEAIRQFYDLVKSGKLQDAVEKAGMAGGPDVPKFGKLIDKDKLPEFSVIAKYLSSSGGYGIMDDDGFFSTHFTLLKANP